MYPYETCFLKIVETATINKDSDFTINEDVDQITSGLSIIQVTKEDESEDEKSEELTQCYSDEDQEKDRSLWIDEKEQQQERRDILNHAMLDLTNGSFKPICSTLNAPFSDITESQQNYYIRKAKEVVKETLSVICPGQEQQLWKNLKEKLVVGRVGDSVSTGRTLDPTVRNLASAYEQAANWQTKRQILSLFASDFSKQQLTTMIKGLTKWRIDQARSHAESVGAGQQVDPKPIYRARLDAVQTDHFLDFISQPAYLQDVAFGTKKLKLDSGEEIIIPAAVRTVIPSRIIHQYRKCCETSGFKPASERTLFRILEVCAASQQKSLQGLDYITTEGSQAHDSLIEIIYTLAEAGASSEWEKEARDLIAASKRYLKSDYKAHLAMSDRCADHCVTHALSDNRNAEYCQKCHHEHDLRCERCQDIRTMLERIESKIMSTDTSLTDDQRAQQRFKWRIAADAVMLWKAHIVRTFNQERAMQTTLASLDSSCVLIVIDWAMKLLPMYYREAMTDFFGKRGRSWHVTCVIQKEPDIHPSVQSFVHVFDDCTQDKVAVLSILEHVLKTIKAEKPAIRKAHLQSDNAGCYHNPLNLFAMKSLSQRTGIAVESYNYTETQSGKGICDRKIASMKQHIRRYVNENHDVVTASEIMEALHSHGGVKGCRVCVADVSSTSLECEKWPGISLLYNFRFERDGIRSWRAYGIGEGKLQRYRDSEPVYVASDDAKLDVLQPFTSQKSSGSISVGARAKSSADIFSCDEPTCVLTFSTEEAMELHMTLGRHRHELERETAYDRIRRAWADRVSELGPSASRVTIPVELVATNRAQAEKGWALKSPKKPVRMTERAKTYLEGRFNRGIQTGKKEDPHKIAREMTNLRCEDGSLFFTPEEWRTPQQIKSFFSRLSSQQRRNELRLNEDDAEALDERVMRTQMRNEVFALVNIDHPVTYKHLNLCSLINQGKLGSLKLTELQKICQYFAIEPGSGSTRRRKTFLKPITDFVTSCPCTGDADRPL